jgi:tetratricopeptide (TPR) repeat protein
LFVEQQDGKSYARLLRLFVPVAPQLGATVQRLTYPLARVLGLDRPAGALVSDVQAPTGLAPGDVILSIEGRAVRNADDIPQQLSHMQPGRTSVQLFRDGKKQYLTIDTSAKAPERIPAQPARQRPLPTVTTRFDTLGMDVASKSGADGMALEVTRISPAAPAELAGLKVGTRIVGVGLEGGIPVPEALREALNRSPPEVGVPLKVSQSGGEGQYVVLRTAQRMLADAEAALALDPNDPHGLAERARALRAKPTTSQATSTQPSPQPALTRPDPAANLQRVNRGIEELNAGRPQQALAELDQAVQADPRSAQALALRGVARLRLGQHDQALEDGSAALALDPQNLMARNVRADAHLGRGRYREAIEELNASLQLQPQQPLAYLSRGQAHAALQNATQALADADEALRLDNSLVAAYQFRGSLHQYRSDFNRAIDDFNAAIKLGAKNVHAYANRALCYTARGRHDWAMADVNRAMELDQRNAQVWYVRGIVQRDMGKLDLAVADLTQAIGHNPQHAEAYYRRGQILRGTGRAAEAQRDFEAAQRLGFRE